MSILRSCTANYMAKKSLMIWQIRGIEGWVRGHSRVEDGLKSIQYFISYTHSATLTPHLLIIRVNTTIINHNKSLHTQTLIHINKNCEFEHIGCTKLEFSIYKFPQYLQMKIKSKFILFKYKKYNKSKQQIWKRTQ